MKLRLFATLLIVQSLLTGCYYTHAFKGQLLQQISQVDIEEYIQHETDLHPVEKHKLELILSVRKFAANEIGLKASTNYTKYFDTHGFAPSYVVSIAYPDKLEYYYRWFPIAGKLPYKGYFIRDMAIDEARKFADKGYDVYVGQAAAYSTAGFFSDPVFSTMLEFDDVYLVGLIIHELLHNTVYKKDFAEFNESLATFFQRAGTLMYIENTIGKDSEVYQRTAKSFADEDLFVDLVKELVSKLDELYAKEITREEKLSEREKIFTGIQDKYREMRETEEFQTDEKDWITQVKLNNAMILNLSTYKFNLDLYQKVYELAGGLRDSIPVFKKAADSDNPLQFLENFVAESENLNK